MNDPKSFDDAVRATAVIGALTEKVSDTNERLARMEPKLDHVARTMDRYAGAMVLVGSVISIVVSIVIAFVK